MPAIWWIVAALAALGGTWWLRHPTGAAPDASGLAAGPADDWAFSSLMPAMPAPAVNDYPPGHRVTPFLGANDPTDASAPDRASPYPFPAMLAAQLPAGSSATDGDMRVAADTIANMPAGYYY